MRLIDADALYEKAEMAFENAPWQIRSVCRWFLGRVTDAPTIDAVEVVRCKECKHRDAIFVCAQFDAEVGANHFCSLGERRSDGCCETSSASVQRMCLLQGVRRQYENDAV